MPFRSGILDNERAMAFSTSNATANANAHCGLRAPPASAGFYPKSELSRSQLNLRSRECDVLNN
jgi:hypothetical protein